jgi:hypothetical protein
MLFSPRSAVVLARRFAEAKRPIAGRIGLVLSIYVANKSKKQKKRHNNRLPGKGEEGKPACAFGCCGRAARARRPGCFPLTANL